MGWMNVLNGMDGWTDGMGRDGIEWMDGRLDGWMSAVQDCDSMIVILEMCNIWPSMHRYYCIIASLLLLLLLIENYVRVLMFCHPVTVERLVVDEKLIVSDLHDSNTEWLPINIIPYSHLKTNKT